MWVVVFFEGKKIVTGAFAPLLKIMFARCVTETKSGRVIESLEFWRNIPSFVAVRYVQLLTQNQLVSIDVLIFSEGGKFVTGDNRCLYFKQFFVTTLTFPMFHTLFAQLQCNAVHPFYKVFHA